MRFPRVFCFGDSLTQGCFNVEEGCWAAILANRYRRKVDFVNRGFSGYNSRQAVHLLPRIYDPSESSLISAFLIWFGANDAVLPGFKQNVEVREYEENLKTVVNFVKNSGVDSHKILLITPPCYDHARWVSRKESLGVPESQVGRTPDRVQVYVEACRKLARNEKLTLVDTFKAMTDYGNWKDLMLDGLHFNTKGASFIADLFATELDDKLSKHPCIFPDNDEANHADPKMEIETWNWELSEK